MTRHSKNNTANSFFTYHERKSVKDFNSLKERLGSCSMRKFEQCWLCLSIATKPVCTPLGYIYCHECIILSLSKQMEENKRRLLQWENDVKEYKNHLSQLEEEEKDQKKRRIIQENLYGISNKISKKSDDDVKQKDLSKNFWLSNGDDKKISSNSGDKLLEKPKNILKCPISGKPLKIKELIGLKPEIVREGDETMWICSISKKPILHHQCYLIKSTGQLILKEYVENSDLESDDKLLSVIPGGTGFSLHNNVQFIKSRPVMRI